MNIPMQREPQPFFITGLGNAAIGGAPNKPFSVDQYPGTFPRVNLNPQFKIGAYNNAEAPSFQLERFNEPWKMRRNTNNPIGVNSLVTKMGNAQNGDNQAKGSGAGKKPHQWSPYQIGSLGVRAGYDQSTPYDRNAMSLDGGVRNVWQFTSNVNMGEQMEIGQGIADMGDVDMQIDQLRAEMN